MQVLRVGVLAIAASFASTACLSEMDVEAREEPKEEIVEDELNGAEKPLVGSWTAETPARGKLGSASFYARGFFRNKLAYETAKSFDNGNGTSIESDWGYTH